MRAPALAARICTVLCLWSMQNNSKSLQTLAAVSTSFIDSSAASMHPPVSEIQTEISENFLSSQYGNNNGMGHNSIDKSHASSSLSSTDGPTHIKCWLHMIIRAEDKSRVIGDTVGYVDATKEFRMKYNLQSSHVEQLFLKGICLDEDVSEFNLCCLELTKFKKKIFFHIHIHIFMHS